MRGFPGGVHVTNSGEVFTLVLRDTTLVALIRDGEVAWSKELPSRYWWTALSTPEGSRFVVSGREGLTYLIEMGSSFHIIEISLMKILSQILLHINKESQP